MTQRGLSEFHAIVMCSALIAVKRIIRTISVLHCFVWPYSTLCVKRNDGILDYIVLYCIVACSVMQSSSTGARRKHRFPNRYRHNDRQVRKNNTSTVLLPDAVYVSEVGVHHYDDEYHLPHLVLGFGS